MPQSYSVVPLVPESSYGSSTALLNQLLQGGGEHGKTSEFHMHGSLVALSLQGSKFLGRKERCGEHYDGGSFP